MEPDTQVEVLEDLTPERAADILEEMSPTTRPTWWPTCPTQTREEILALMERDEAAEVQELLGYPEDIGRRDHDHRVRRRARRRSPRPRRSIGCASSSPTRRRSTTSTSTDDDGRLVGVLSLRDLIVAHRPRTRSRDVMITRAGGRAASGNQDDVAAVVARYNLLAVPVVDDDGHARGHRDRRRRDRHHPADGLEEAPAAALRPVDPQAAGPLIRTAVGSAAAARSMPRWSSARA